MCVVKCVWIHFEKVLGPCVWKVSLQISYITKLESVCHAVLAYCAVKEGDLSHLDFLSLVLFVL